MKDRWLNRKLYSLVLILAILISFFSSTGTTNVFAQAQSWEIRQAGLLNVHQTGIRASRSSRTPAALPPGTTLLPTTLVHITDTSNATGGWNPSSPDPSGIDYWPLTGKLLISDSEVDEIAAHWMNANVYQATTSGTLVSTCRTTTFSSEPSGVAINPNNNHIFFSDDNGQIADRVFEVSLGPDGTYCTSDDTVVSTPVGTSYGATDAEDVAYGNNTLFISDGVNAEVYVVPLGANGALGGGDDGSVTHFDTASLGFNNVEGIGYNADSGTLFILSALPAERFLGEITTAGILLKAYNLASAGLIHPEDVTYAPGSLDPAIKNIYITDRGEDNNDIPNENDGRIFEINLGIPRVASIQRASANPTAAASVNFTVTFSEAVTGVDVTDFALAPTGVSGVAINGVSGSGTTYTVTVNTGSGNGTIQLNVTDDDSITDAVGLKLGGIGVGNGSFTTGAVYTINKTPTAPLSATLTSPTGSSATNNPTYTWNKVSDATWYNLYVSGPSNYVLTKWYLATDVCGASTCSVIDATPGLASGTYQWWVQTWNSVGYGPWSAGLTFTIPAPTPPAAASLVSPNGSITTNNPTYTWNKVSDATWYNLYVSGPSGYVFSQWYLASNVCGASTCSVANATTLSVGTQTFWIQTWNSAGGYGPWSTGMSFSSVPPGTATLISPNSTTTNNPTYTWNKVSDATWYNLYVSGPSGYVFTQWYLASNVCGANTCSAPTPTPGLAGGQYRWWIQTWNNAGYGPWSSGLNFSVP